MRYPITAGFLLLLLATPLTAAPRPATLQGAGCDEVGAFSIASNFALLRLGPQALGSERRFHFGDSNTAFSGVIPVAGDFNGDGKDSLGIFDSKSGSFQLGFANANQAPDLTFTFGPAGTFPVTGDFNGDGVDTIGTFNPSTRTFRLRNSNNGGPPQVEFSFGHQDGFPVAGDFNGDGVDTVGTFDVITGEFLLAAANSAGANAIQFHFSGPRGYPVVGDFDGDGVDTLGTFIAAEARFLLKNDYRGTPPDTVIDLEADMPFWFPIAGDWYDSTGTGELSAYDWPIASPSAHGFDTTLLGQALSIARKMEPLHSLLVVRHGFLVEEMYYRGYDAGTANCIKSVSKSILSALFGIAWKQGLYSSTSQTAASLAPQYFLGSSPATQQINIAHLLTMTAGISWSETGSFLPMTQSGPDWVEWIVEQPLVTSPGTKFNYSTGLTHLGSAILTQVAGVPTRDFAEAHLFAPLGITATRWDRDPNGLFFGGSEVFMRPRDMARFGQLYLGGGVIDGNTIVDPLWVQESTKPIVAVDSISTYGAWWWQRKFDGVDSFAAIGHGGQIILVVPDRDLVVVMTSDWTQDQAEVDSHFSSIFDLLDTYVVPSAK